MKKLYFVFMMLLAGLIAFGQDTTVSVMYATTTPEIDGIIDEIWQTIEPVPIEKNYFAETPTVTAYWKAMWDEIAVYVLLYVEDDDHYPAWESGGDWFVYDQAEVYFDVNEILKDGLGTRDYEGHYQAQPEFEEGGSGKPQEYISGRDDRPDCFYAYVLDGENYVFEYEFEYENFTNGDGEEMTVDKFRELEKIGFDVYVIDQDEGITTSRQRAVWSNTGGDDGSTENYINMDDAGTIVLADPPTGFIPKEVQTFSVYPNPVSSNVRLSVDCDRIQVSNMLGQAVETIELTGRWASLESLNTGMYFIEGFRNGKSVGFTKIIKK